MRRRFDRIHKIVVVDQGRELRHYGIHFLLRVEIHPIRIVASSVFMHQRTLRQIRRNEFCEALEVVLVAATDIENLWTMKMAVEKFFTWKSQGVDIRGCSRLAILEVLL